MKVSEIIEELVEIPAEYVTNSKGVRIKKCCASCAFKNPSRRLGKRLCTKHGLEVNPCDRCSLWRMRGTLRKLGSGETGNVKRYDYLMYALEELKDVILMNPDEELEDDEAETEEVLQTVTVTTKSIDEIRMEFEKEHDSIYIKHSWRSQAAKPSET